MARRRDRISIEVFGPSASPETAGPDAGRADEAILALARLIGRQMARKQFERGLAAERKFAKRHDGRRQPE